MPGPVSVMATATLPGFGATANADGAAFGRVLDGVEEEVEECLLQQVLIGLGGGGADVVGDERHPRCRRLRREEIE